MLKVINLLLNIARQGKLFRDGQYIKETFFHVWIHYLNISVVKLRLWNSWSNCYVVEILWLVISQMNLKKIDTSACVSIGQIERKSSKVVSVIADCAPCIAGQTAWFVTLFSKAVRHSVVPCHCTIHQEALWAKGSQQTLEQQTGTATKWLISCLFGPSTVCS